MRIFNRLRLNRVIQFPILVINLLLICFSGVFYYGYIKINKVTESLSIMRKDVGVIDNNLLIMSSVLQKVNKKTSDIDELMLVQNRVANLFTINIPDPEDKLMEEISLLNRPLTK